MIIIIIYLKQNLSQNIEREFQLSSRNEIISISKYNKKVIV